MGSFHLGLGGDTALGVGDLHAESLGLGDDVDTLAGRDGVADPVILLEPISIFHFRRSHILSSVGAVVHEQELNVLGVLDEEGLVAGRSQVAGLLVGTVTNLCRTR